MYFLQGADVKTSPNSYILMTHDMFILPKNADAAVGWDIQFR